MKNVLLISHYTEIPGAGDKLVLYLKKHNYSLFFILNPLNPKSSLKSIIKTDKKEIRYKIFWPIQYVLEGIISFIKYKVNFKKISEFDLAICIDPLSFVQTFIFKRFFKIKKIVYYNTDFSTKRFKNKVINFIYLFFNKFAYKNCNYFFYLTKNFIRNIDPTNKYNNKNFLLRHTININIRGKITKKIPKSIIYAGSLSYTVDFVDLIKAFESIKKENINFIFDIYGNGNQKEQLKVLIDSSIIKDNVNFKGVTSNEILLKEILPKYTIGVCPYIINRNEVETDCMFNCMFTGTDLTTKIVEYIACSLPVITTRLYEEFDVIEKNQFGFLVHTSEEWCKAIKNLLLDKKLYMRYRNNALNFAKNYDEEKVLTPVFNKILQD